MELNHNRFRTNPSALKMAAACFSETMMSYLCTRLLGAVRTSNTQKIPRAIKQLSNLIKIHQEKLQLKCKGG